MLSLSDHWIEVRKKNVESRRKVELECKLQ
jgi:hypothetical protein